MKNFECSLRRLGFALLLAVLCCCGRSNLILLSDCVQCVTPTPTPTVDVPQGSAESNNEPEFLLQDAVDPHSLTRNASAKELVSTAHSSSTVYRNLSLQIVAKLKSVCFAKGHTLDGDQFDRITLLSSMVASLKDRDGLEALVDCLPVRSIVGGRSLSNVPVKDGILEFGVDAIPALAKGYRDADSPTKCDISGLLALIGGSESIKELIILRRNEHNVIVQKCVTNSLQFAQR
jgi:hypothetical protein